MTAETANLTEPIEASRAPANPNALVALLLIFAVLPAAAAITSNGGQVTAHAAAASEPLAAQHEGVCLVCLGRPAVTWPKPVFSDISGKGINIEPPPRARAWWHYAASDLPPPLE